jgi:ABC-type sugar transport system ATPase subunit
MDYALEMLDIVKEFPGVKALRGVTLQVRPGHVHALMGENGAGKSTLMKILDGVYPAGSYQGRMVIDGQEVAFGSPHDARMRGIGYVPQEINDPRRPISTLAASQRQLVMIARALSTNPRVLILDESTSSLTLEETGNLFRIVRHLQSRGVTCLFITHKMAELFELADRVTVLRDGAVVSHFQRGGFQEGDIVSAMVGRRIDQFYPHRDSPIGDVEVLKVQGLTVPHPHLARRNVVEDLSFTLRRGEILGIAGLVGSGRTETVNALYGRIPCRGQIEIQGRPAKIRRPRDAKRLGLGLLTEERKKEGLLFNFGIRENISINHLAGVSRFGLLSRRKENQIARLYMQQLVVRAPSPTTPVLNLSGGNQQKVVLAKALVAGPTVLMLDDPTKGVDVGAKNEIYKLMLDLARQGIAQIVISSELPELLAMCDRLIVLWRGKKTAELTKQQATQEKVMLAATGATIAASVRQNSRI